MTGGRAKEKPPPRLLWSTAGPWKPTGQLVGNSRAVYAKPIKGSSRIGNQARLAFKRGK